MIDLYLRASTEEELMEALESAGIISDNEKILLESAAIDKIGQFSRIVNEVTVDYTDFHINLRLPYIDDSALEILSKYSIEPPETPYRIWG